jgi:Cu(I)/Ag(I) efflux system membrane protein CusA/SilA
VTETASEVGPALFFSLLIITVSFIPVFALEAQEGRLFKPLAFTKTYAMAAAAILSVTLVPVLMGYFVRGRIIAENRNPLNTGLARLYRPCLAVAMAYPWLTIGAGALLAASVAWPLTHTGSEFMPELDEGDLLYMPSLMPGVSIGKAREVLQQTDRLIATVPEVEHVHGKVGRAETATDPAPLTMVETTIRLKPRADWRPGVTMDDIRAELDRIVQVPGVTNVWIMPIKNRIDMLSTGVKTPVGVKISGPDLAEIGRLGREIERAVAAVPGTLSAYAERPVGGRFLTVDIDRTAAARYGLNITQIQDVVRTAIGGLNVTESIEGLERFPVNLRYPADWRNSPDALRQLPIVTPSGAHIALADVADIRIDDGPGMIRTENARLNGWVFIDIAGRDLGGYVHEARRVVTKTVALPAGYSVTWSGQFEYLQRVEARLSVIAPLTIVIIALMLWMTFGRAGEVLIVLSSLPVALAGGVWLLWLLGYDLSVAVMVGVIALAGVAAETVIVMLVYLNLAMAKRIAAADRERRAVTGAEIEGAIVEGALLRLRPKLMTVATIFAGLLPIMFGSGTGSEVMRRIATPMVGGMVTATFLTLVVVPAIYLVWQRRAMARRLVGVVTADAPVAGAPAE